MGDEFRGVRWRTKNKTTWTTQATRLPTTPGFSMRLRLYGGKRGGHWNGFGYGQILCFMGSVFPMAAVSL